MLSSVEPLGDETPPEQRRPDPVAHRRVDAVADRLALDEAFEDIDDDFRTAVVLRDVGDLDYSEIADVLGVPVGTVKSRIARGRKQLAERLRVDDLPMIDSDDTTPLPTDEFDRADTSDLDDREGSRELGNREDGFERPNDST